MDKREIDRGQILHLGREMKDLTFVVYFSVVIRKKQQQHQIKLCFLFKSCLFLFDRCDIHRQNIYISIFFIDRSSIDKYSLPFVQSICPIEDNNNEHIDNDSVLLE